MIVSQDGYAIEHYRNRNQIVIIRAMTDEELAEWLEAHCYQYGWLDWLKEEAGE